MGVINVLIPGGSHTLELEHKAVSWFARELIDWRSGRHGPEPESSNSSDEAEAGARRHYGTGINHAENELKRLKIPFEPISLARQPNMISRGYAQLLDTEIAFFQAAFEHVWLPGISIETAEELAARAREKARLASTSAPRVPSEEGLTPAAYARLLGLNTQPGSQIDLADFVGDYLIFRRIAKQPKIVVSHMKVQQDGKACYPAEFVTMSSALGAGGGQDFVRGIIYRPPEERNVLFAVGKYMGTTQVRSSILEAVQKPVFEPEQFPNDLRGIRLGLSRPYRQPLGYRIWCSRLDDAYREIAWRRFAREYALQGTDSQRLADVAGFYASYAIQPHGFFEKHVRGLDGILKWLNTTQYASLDDE